MKDNLELHSRDKKVHKMTREGLVEENLSQGTGKRISDRVLDAKLDRPVDQEMNFSAGRVDEMCIRDRCRPWHLGRGQSDGGLRQ